MPVESKYCTAKDFTVWLMCEARLHKAEAHGGQGVSFLYKLCRFLISANYGFRIYEYFPENAESFLEPVKKFTLFYVDYLYRRIDRLSQNVSKNFRKLKKEICKV